MKCPKCGYNRQTRDNAFVPATECPSCGVVYSKHENKAPVGPARSSAPAAPNLRPSPVDAGSLKKARDRVEKRLRQRLGTTGDDDRHAETLKRAKLIAEEEMRKRQEERNALMVQEASMETLSEVEAEDDQETASPQEALETLDEAIEKSPGPEKSQPEAAVEAAEQSSTDSDPIAPEPEVDAETEDVQPASAEGAAETDDTPEKAPEPKSDVKMETVILTSKSAAFAMDTAAPVYDATQVDLASPTEDEQELQGDSAFVDDNHAPDTAEAMQAPLPSLLQGLSRSGNGLVRMLSAVAWLILGAGVIGAILSWTTISDVQAGMRIPVPDSLTTLPLGLLLGFAYLATGVLGFAFFWVSSIISRQLKDIRRLLMLPVAPMADDATETLIPADETEQPRD